MVETSPQPVIVQWMLDTREWYPEATKSAELAIYAARALRFISDKEREKATGFFLVRDAKCQIASALLKRYAISRLAGVPWGKVQIGKNEDNRKPIYEDPITKTQPVSFNVSHQNGVVVIIAAVNKPSPGPPPPPTPPPDAAGGGGGNEQEGEQQALPQPQQSRPPFPPAELGVDIVCISERRDKDYRSIAEERWKGFVDSYAGVLNKRERAYLKGESQGDQEREPGLSPAPFDEEDTDGKLRILYTLWALREAFSKMTGHGLAAPWFEDLDFPKIKPPKPTAGWHVPAREDDGSGEVINRVEVRLHKERLKDVNINLRSVGPDFMIATVVRTPGRAEALEWKLGPYEELSLEEVLQYAEASGM